MIFDNSMIIDEARGGFRGGGGRPPPLRDSTPCRPKGSPLLVLFKKQIFGRALAPIYTNFEWGARAEKAQFFYQNFPKSAEKRLFGLLFKKFSCGAEISAKTKQDLFSALGEIGESIWLT